MLIKICGLKYVDNVSSVLQMKPDFAGFNFYHLSPRYVSYEEMNAMKEIDFGNTKKAGVFVNEDSEKILAIAEHYKLQFIQLHGNESVDKTKKIKKYFKVIKAIGIETKDDMMFVKEYESSCNYILLDKKSSSYGGTGIPFDWKLIENYSSSVPFLLGGGISPDNIEAAKSIQHPMFAGLDLNSCFEDSPGLKNVCKLRLAFE